MAEPIPIPPDSALADEIRTVHAYYQALAQLLHPAHALGGRLIYAGQLSPESASLIRAANIAGAASLAVSNSPDACRQAMRTGVVDFLVTSLDEALRILKNEIRKRLPVAVAVQGTPAQIGNEMMIRGVQPDLLIATAAAITPLCARAAFMERGARLLEPCMDEVAAALRIWPVPAAWNARMSELDTQLAALLHAEALAERRWLRLSPRYLGTQARRFRSLACNEATAAQLDMLLR